MEADETHSQGPRTDRSHLCRDYTEGKLHQNINLASPNGLCLPEIHRLVSNTGADKFDDASSTNLINVIGRYYFKADRRVIVHVFYAL